MTSPSRLGARSWLANTASSVRWNTSPMKGQSRKRSVSSSGTRHSSTSAVTTSVRRGQQAGTRLGQVAPRLPRELLSQLHADHPVERQAACDEERLALAATQVCQHIIGPRVQRAQGPPNREPLAAFIEAAVCWVFAELVQLDPPGRRHAEPALEIACCSLSSAQVAFHAKLRIGAGTSCRITSRGVIGLP